MFVVHGRKHDGATQKDRYREVNQKGHICRIHVDSKNSGCNSENIDHLIHIYERNETCIFSKLCRRLSDGWVNMKMNLENKFWGCEVD
jgi:hypothetical protein